MVVILRLPHLVLTDVGDDHGVTFCLAPQIIDHVRGIQMSVIGKILNVPHRRILLRDVDLRPPLGMPVRLHQRQESLQDFAQISDQRHVHLHELVDFRPVNLHVNFLGLLRVGIELAGNTVIKAHT